LGKKLTALRDLGAATAADEIPKQITVKKASTSEIPVILFIALLLLFEVLRSENLLRLRVAEINNYKKIVPDFGSSSRRANGSILAICNFWRNAEDGPKNK